MKSSVLPRREGSPGECVGVARPVSPPPPYAPMMSRSAFALLASLLLVASCTSSSNAEPVDPGRLVLWTEDSIAVLEGGEVSDIETTGAISQVTPAQDGRLVWTRITRDPPSVDAVIAGGTRKDLETPTVPFFYEWNPTGTRVAFLGNAPSGAGLVFGLIDVDGEGVTSIEGPAPFFFDWSPDGERLIAHVGGSSLGIIEADTGDVEELPEASGAFPAPFWNERGIVVVTRVGPAVSSPVLPVGYQAAISAIVLIDPDGGSRTPLAEVDGPVRLFPGDESLALIGGSAGDQRIEVITWDGDRIVTLGEGTIELAQWSPDGATLLWTERSADGTLTPMTWIGGDRAEYEAFQPSSVFATDYLPFWDQYDRTISLWSLDSAAFVLPSIEGVIVNEVDGESSLYEDWEMAVWSASEGDG